MEREWIRESERERDERSEKREKGRVREERK